MLHVSQMQSETAVLPQSEDSDCTPFFEKHALQQAGVDEGPGALLTELGTALITEPDPLGEAMPEEEAAPAEEP